MPTVKQGVMCMRNNMQKGAKRLEVNLGRYLGPLSNRAHPPNHIRKVVLGNM